MELEAGSVAAALRDDARAGLTGRPKDLPPKWLYDDRGCEFFDEITRLPEYYQTRTERSLLLARAPDIARLTGADTLVELGSGTSDKTRALLDALAAAGTLRRFAPFDVAEATLRAAAEAIAAEYPGIAVEAVVGDFEHHLHLLPGGGRRLIAFLGGTIGNLHPPERAKLLGRLAQGMAPGDRFLLGVDLVKDRDRLVAAYDDAAGVTAAFNRNVLAVLNRELGARFDLDAFDHVARFDDEEENIEMWLRSRRRQVVPVAALGIEVTFEEGEEMRTEISAKFRPEGLRAELEAAGLAPVRWWTDPAGDFGLSLSRRSDAR
ncbi:MAG TPA: L-histidine N(alpha)-methyltransferase [Acidimicrobiales bacterium]|nr:L-histidine N(alpha)-methyltransferase [Acidimicrobiales bacterium]